ncbi:MAG: asparagine synthase (glutamine-hydrolyzing) [Phocaeicola sp.]
MCGISGIIKLNDQKVEESRMRLMMEKMRHRGPNDESLFMHHNVGLGFLRLSILDLSMAGRQPMQDETERYTIIFNGEIFNYIELREELLQMGVSFKSNTDTEVLLQCYIKYGEASLHKFNGMFAFVIYDKLHRKIFGARDRFGVKPLYYYQNETEFIFASEIRSIISVYNQPNQANEEAIFDYLAFNRTDQTTNTFFKGVQKIAHGCCFTIENNQFTTKQWYQLKEKIKKEKITPAQYQLLLLDAIKLRLRSDVPVGVCLSGGIDSSAITSLLLKKLGCTTINSFSAIYEQGDKADESSYINLYKEELKNMHFIYPTAETLKEDLAHFVLLHAEPIPSTGPYAQYQVFKKAKEKVTVTLDGQGADEELGGYHYFYGFYFKELLASWKIGKLCKELVAYTRIHRSLYGLKTFLFFLLPQRYRTELRVTNRKYITTSFYQKILKSGYTSTIENLYSSKSLKEALLNHFEYKLEHLLKWNDINSMAHSVESRTPFLDYRVVEQTLSLPAHEIIANGYTKSILRESLKGILPEQIRMRKDKKGFDTPQEEWFRTPYFKEFIKELLTSVSFKNRNIINPEVAMKLFQQHEKREINIAKDIWKWIHLELWFREFIDTKE